MFFPPLGEVLGHSASGTKISGNASTTSGIATVLCQAVTHEWFASLCLISPWFYVTDQENQRPSYLPSQTKTYMDKKNHEARNHSTSWTENLTHPLTAENPLSGPSVIGVSIRGGGAGAAWSLFHPTTCSCASARQAMAWNNDPAHSKGSLSWSAFVKWGEWQDCGMQVYVCVLEGYKREQPGDKDAKCQFSSG